MCVKSLYLSTLAGGKTCVFSVFAHGHRHNPIAYIQLSVRHIFLAKLLFPQIECGMCVRALITNSYAQLPLSIILQKSEQIIVYIHKGKIYT